MATYSFRKRSCLKIKRQWGETRETPYVYLWPLEVRIEISTSTCILCAHHSWPQDTTHINNYIMHLKIVKKIVKTTWREWQNNWVDSKKCWLKLKGKQLVPARTGQKQWFWRKSLTHSIKHPLQKALGGLDAFSSHGR